MTAPLRRPLLALGVATLASCAASCARGPSQPDEGPIRVAVIMPQSGDLGPDGQLWLKGIRMATQEVNAAGGPLPGRPIELLVLDSRTMEDVAVSEAMRAIGEEGVVAVIGDGGSGGTLAIYNEVTSNAGVPQVSCCATSPRLTEASMAAPDGERFFFRTVPSDALQSQVVGRIADDRGCTRLAILHLDDAYGGPLAAATAADFTRRGGSVVATVPYTDGLSMYATETRMIADANPECVALIGYPRTAGNILRSYYMLTSPPTVTWIGTDGLRTDTFVTEAGTALLATVQFYGAAPITQPDGPAYEDFSQRHRALFAELPGPFVSNSYDAAALLYLGIARAQGTAGRPIMNAVRSLNTGTVVRAGELATGLAQIQREEAVNYEGASGSVDVDAYGDVRTDYEIWRVNAAGTAIDRVERVPASELD